MVMAFKVWMGPDVEEVAAAQVAVAALVAGVDGRGLDGGFDLRGERVVADGDGAGEVGELAADLRDEVAPGRWLPAGLVDGGGNGGAQSLRL
jgi:hypothetical protein